MFSSQDVKDAAFPLATVAEDHNHAGALVKPIYIFAEAMR